MDTSTDEVTGRIQIPEEGTGADPSEPGLPPNDVVMGCSVSLFGMPVRTVETICLLVLAAASDMLLYRHPGGTGYGTLLLLTVAALFVPNVARVGNASWILVAAVAAISARAVWNHTSLLGITGAACTAGAAVKFLRPEWKILEISRVVPGTYLMGPFRAAGHLFHWMGYFFERRGESVRLRRNVPVQVIMVPMFVATAFILIFSAANPVINRMVSSIWKNWTLWLQDVFDFVTFGRIFWWLLWLSIFAGLIRPVLTSWTSILMKDLSDDLAIPKTDEENKTNFDTALVTLITVNAVFLAFNTMDALYLYFKAALPEGISYSAYSRRGCAWLTLALALTTVVIGYVFRGRLNFYSTTRKLKTWAYIWAAQNVVLAAGALGRINMYIEYNGLTRVRIVGIYGVLLVTVGLGFMIRKVAKTKSFVWLIRNDVLAFCTTVILLSLTPSDLISWKYNAARATKGNFRPLAGLVQQKMSPESYPPLIPLIYHEDEMVRKGTSAILQRVLEEMRAKQRHCRFSERQLSRSWAVSRLTAAESEMKAIVTGTDRAQAEKQLKQFVGKWIHTRRIVD